MRKKKGRKRQLSRINTNMTWGVVYFLYLVCISSQTREWVNLSAAEKEQEEE